MQNLSLDLKSDFEGDLSLLSLISKTLKKREVLAYDIIWEKLTPGNLCQILLKSKWGSKVEMVCYTKTVTALSFIGWKTHFESLGKNVTRSQFKYEHIGVTCSEGQV